MLRALALLLLSPLAMAQDAAGPDAQAFVAATFDGKAPEPAQLWITGPLREQAAAILGHEPGARLSYWRRGARTTWVLEEIGKERPITAGFAIDHGQLTRVQVLAYRESRGGEIGLSAFTRQFAGAALTDSLQLDKSIDNISGATLSVRALKRMARLALLYDRKVSL
jgi:hypothetical protein